MKNMSVLLIGDELRRNLIKRELRGSQNLVLAGEICEADALRLVPALDVDLIVLDFAAQHVNGLATLPWLAGLPGRCSIVVLGASGTPTERRLALELGADGYAPLEGVTRLLRTMPVAQAGHGASRTAGVA